MQDFKDQYGEEEGERIYYATAKKQGRDPDTFKKESVELLDDIVLETNEGMHIIPKGTVVTEVAVTTGNIAVVPGQEAPKKDDEEEEEVEESSNSQVSPLQQDH